MPFDPITIATGLAFVAFKAHDQSLPVPVKEFFEQFLSGAFGNYAHADVEKLRKSLAGWAQGAHPAENMDLDRAVTRSAIHADLFCVTEALGEPVELPEGRLERWQQLLRDRLPKRTPAVQTLFSDQDKRQLRHVREECFQRLRELEERPAPSEIRADRLILPERQVDYGSTLAVAAFDALELPGWVRPVFQQKWFSYLCGSFHHEVKHNQPVANIFLVQEMAEIKEILRERLPAVGGAAAASHWYSLPALGLFVGRDTEREVALTRWFANRERPLLIWGPPGIGKSTLALGCCITRRRWRALATGGSTCAAMTVRRPS